MYENTSTIVLIETKFKNVRLNILEMMNVIVVPTKNNACNISSNCCFAIQSQKVTL